LEKELDPEKVLKIREKFREYAKNQKFIILPDKNMSNKSVDLGMPLFSIFE